MANILKRFPQTFWVANTMELFERWAWYGLFTVLAVYLTESTDTGALGFSQTQKGTIMGVVTAILYLLPIFTGALADKVGFKKVLIFAYIILASGYYLMGTLTGYAAVFAVFLLIALGAALFKPIISATISKTTTNETSSIGFGIYYMLVNIGGFLGPVVAVKVKALSWDYVFLMATFSIIINLILVIFLYKEPQREKNTNTLFISIKSALKNIFTVLTDGKYLLFLLIIAGFWTMFNQIFYTLPNFISQWVDTTVLYNAIADISPALAASIGEANGTIDQAMIISIDAGLIILFQVIISTIVMRFKPLGTMITGIFICSIAVGIAFMTGNGFYVILGLVLFSVGEMTSSPKFTEYVGSIAPADKKALYMGTSYLPMALGNLLAGVFSGPVYQSLSDKVTLLQTEMQKRGFQMPQITEDYTINSFYTDAASRLEMTQTEMADMLWQTYNPSQIWYIFTAIGLLATVSLFIYDKVFSKKIQ